MPGTPVSKDELEPELRLLYKELNVENVLSGWSLVNKVLEDADKKQASEASMYLLVLNPNVFHLDITPYKAGDLALANIEYARVEKEKPELQAVLVSVDSLASLRTAYPNYFFDTAGFIRFIKKFLNEPRRRVIPGMVPAIRAELPTDGYVGKNLLSGE